MALANPRVALVVAVAANGVMGRAGALPWHLPDDLKRFKALTMGKPMIMGRSTFDSIGKPLPGRRSIVLTRAPRQELGGVEWAGSFQAACDLAQGAEELCVIGGAQVFQLALPHASLIHLTRLHAAVAGDVYFPLQDFSAWRELERVEHPADERHFCAMSFLTLAPR